MPPRLIAIAPVARAREAFRRYAIGLPLLLALHARQAEAQSCPEGPADEARPHDQVLFYRGAALREQGRHDEACACFYESQHLAYDSKKLLILAECDERSGQLRAAHAKYQELLQQLPAQPDTKYRADRERSAREGIAQLERRFVRLVLAPSPTPGASVSINGQPAPVGETPPLDPGIYRLEVKAPGYETHHERLSLMEGQRLEYALPALTPIERSRFGLAPPILIGTGGLLAGFGTYYGLSALSSGRRLERSCDTADTSARCDQLEKDWTSKADTATWLWVGAGLFAAAGITLYVLEPASPRAPGETSLSAWGGLGAAGVRATGSF